MSLPIPPPVLVLLSLGTFMVAGASPDARDGSPAAGSAPDPVVKVAVLELAVVDNSLNGDSDSLRLWMVESGIEPTRLLREAVSRPGTYSMMEPRPAFSSVEETRIERVLSSNGVEAVGCRTPACVREVGRALGADRVITGEVTKLSVLIWFVTARVSDVRSGAVLRQDELEVKGVITDLMPKVMAVLARRFATL